MTDYRYVRIDKAEPLTLDECRLFGEALVNMSSGVLAAYGGGKWTISNTCCVYGPDTYLTCAEVATLRAMAVVARSRPEWSDTEAAPPVMGSTDGRTWRPVQPMDWQEEHGWLARLAFWLRGVPHCNDEAHRRSVTTKEN